MNNDDNWDEVDSNTEKEIEYEIEEAEDILEASSESMKVSVENPKDPEELEGIETRGAEKRIRQLVKQRKEREEQIEELSYENQKLQEELVSKNSEVTRISKSSLDMSEKQLNDKVHLARAAYMEAFEDGDKEKVLQAQEILNDSQADLKNISQRKQYFNRLPEPVIQEAAPKRDVVSLKAKEWASDNEWFGQDSIMTAAALAVDAELKEEGYDPNEDDFYSEVNNRIKRAFPQKFGEVEERVQENTRQPAQVVSGASRSSPSSSKKVKLSAQDISLAQKWNIPLEQYAAEKLKVTQADGEYTVVT
tara:strand:- start:535 stop:1452 length:918 start_codon:yes stop_codon:yes gene_type:complete